MNKKVEEISDSIKSQTNREVKSLLSDVEPTIVSFSENLRELIKELSVAIESSINIGVIGRFSHGKSSLLNAILRNPGEEDLLLTGAGVVTAVPTIIKFNQGPSVFYKERKNGRGLTLKEFKNKVGKFDDGSESISGLIVEYGIGNKIELNDYLKNKIWLIDTPGLGGPYFQDHNMVRSWMEKMSLVILVLKADEINRNTVRDVQYFLKNYEGEIVICVTFWDLWTSSEVYAKCSNESDARELAYELINDNFSPYNKRLEKENIIYNTSFVSALNYLNQSESPKGFDVKFTELDDTWGVANTNVMLNRYVRENIDLLNDGEVTESLLASDKTARINLKSDRLLSTREELSTLIKRINKDPLRVNRKSLFVDINYDDYWFERIQRVFEDTSERISEKVRAYVDDLDLKQVDDDEVEDFNLRVRNIYEKEVSRMKKRLEKQLLLLKQRLLDKMIDSNIDETLAEKIIARKFNVDFSDFDEIQDEIRHLKLLKKPTILKQLSDRLRHKSKSTPHEQNRRIKNKWINVYAKKNAVKIIFEERWREAIEGEIKDDFEVVDEKVKDLISTGSDFLNRLIEDLEDIRDDLSVFEEMRRAY
jgi:hypothetical protein